MRFARKASKDFVIYFVALSLACMFLAPCTSLVHPVLEDCRKRTVKRSKETQVN